MLAKADIMTKPAGPHPEDRIFDCRPGPSSLSTGPSKHALPDFRSSDGVCGATAADPAVAGGAVGKQAGLHFTGD